MIYNMFSTLFQSVKGFCQFWGLRGLVFMTSAVIRDFNPLMSQASSLKAKPIVRVINSDTPLVAASFTEPGTYPKDRQVTFPEIFSHALPSSPKVLELNNLVEQIWIVREGTSLVDRDDSKTAQAFLLIADIVNLHWDDFSLKTKVLLLDKLRPFNKSVLQFIVEVILKLPSALKEKKERNRKYGSEYNSLDRSAQQELVRKLRSNFSLLITSIFKILNATSKIFKKDGYLLEENKENINRFNHSVKTMLSARQGMRDYRQTLIELGK
jgi:hypothetical protein